MAVTYNQQKEDQMAMQRDASSKLNAAILRGEVVRPKNCSQCGSDGRIEGHHSDYSKVLDVQWLCHRCHKNLHKALRSVRIKTPRKILNPPLRGKQHLTFRACGPIRAIVANEMRSDKNKTRVLEKLIAAGARLKYPKLVERFNILQEEAA